MSPLRAARTLAFIALVPLAPIAVGGGFVDVLDTPAQSSLLPSRSMMQAVARAGTRIVAVGQRGMIVVSDDAGANWKQARVPVSSDLLAAYFVDAKRGWVVGHDGVVLRTDDAGDTWQMQFDGRRANDLLVEAMTKKAAAEPGSEDAKKLLAEAQRYKEQGPDKPFMDVWFADANNGYIVGAYNLVFKTEDGGKTWVSWFDRTDNPKFFNLHAIRPAAGSVYIVGESGLVMKLDAAANRFKALATPYNGSFFGVVEAKSSVLAFGLRGNVYRSDDTGATWTKVDAQLASAVVASMQSPSNATLLADSGGRVVATDDGGRTFTKVPLPQTLPVTGLADAGDGRVALSGPRGVSITQIARP
jgi:photosystem II stability/assembly factor-like uncharacterized protein